MVNHQKGSKTMEFITEQVGEIGSASWLASWSRMTEDARQVLGPNASPDELADWQTSASARAWLRIASEWFAGNGQTRLNVDYAPPVLHELPRE
jgi:hypothetical protein